MFDTLVQISLSPVVTLSVIAALTILLVLSFIDSKRRLRKQATRLGKMTSAMLTAVVESAAKEMRRRENKAIEFTYNTLQGIGWEKLATGRATIDDVIFGASPTGRRRDPFSMDELAALLGGKPRFHNFRDFMGGRDPYAGLADEIRKGTEAHSAFSAPHNRDAGEEESGDAKEITTINEAAHGFEDHAIHSGDSAGLEGKGPRPYHFTGDARSPRAG